MTFVALLIPSVGRVPNLFVLLRERGGEQVSSAVKFCNLPDLTSINSSNIQNPLCILDTELRTGSQRFRPVSRAGSGADSLPSEILESSGPH